MKSLDEPSSLIDFSANLALVLKDLHVADERPPKPEAGAQTAAMNILVRDFEKRYGIKDREVAERAIFKELYSDNMWAKLDI